MLENGDTFFGEYRGDRHEGQGLYLFAGGGAYAGSFRQSRRDGEGQLLLPDGSLYNGTFAGDQFSGVGRYEYPDGSLYIGSWSAGTKHGKVPLRPPTVALIGRHYVKKTLMSCEYDVTEDRETPSAATGISAFYILQLYRTLPWRLAPACTFLLVRTSIERTLARAFRTLEALVVCSKHMARGPPPAHFQKSLHIVELGKASLRIGDALLQACSTLAPASVNTGQRL